MCADQIREAARQLYLKEFASPGFDGKVGPADILLPPLCPRVNDTLFSKYCCGSRLASIGRDSDCDCGGDFAS